MDTGKVNGRRHRNVVDLIFQNNLINWNLHISPDRQQIRMGRVYSGLLLNLQKQIWYALCNQSEQGIRRSISSISWDLGVRNRLSARRQFCHRNRSYNYIRTKYCLLSTEAIDQISWTKPLKLMQFQGVNDVKAGRSSAILFRPSSRIVAVSQTKQRFPIH